MELGGDSAKLKARIPDFCLDFNCELKDMEGELEDEELRRAMLILDSGGGGGGGDEALAGALAVGR